MPLRTFGLNGLTVGGLVRDDPWANPEWTPVDDPHLSRRLARMGARVVFHAVNAGSSTGDELALNRAYHDANPRLRARSGRQWVIVANAADPKAEREGNVVSGIVDPRGTWTIQAEPKGERFFAATIDIDP
jgi:predicted amidohydrolase